MSKKSNSTPSALIDAAGQLFSQHGYSAVSTRMIAELANVAHSSIHYHFETKEAIYKEVFLRIFDLENALDHEKLLEKEPYVLKSPDGKAYAIHRIVRDYFTRNAFYTEQWKRDLVIREIFDHSPAFKYLVDNVLRLELDKRREFFYLLKPDGSSEESFFWANVPDTQGLFYLLNWQLIEKYHGADFMPALQQHVIKTTSVMMIQLLDLPIPEMLR
jgi:AcrR family transcriptional regulator